MVSNENWVLETIEGQTSSAISQIQIVRIHYSLFSVCRTGNSNEKTLNR